jgi:hypothetical protein
VPAIEIPKFVAGLANQPFTKAVTSTNRKALAVLTGMVTNEAAVAGPGKVTVDSPQAEVTCENVSEPAAVTLLT